MTIDEAIQHCEEKARELGCTECAQEHRQLAAWLRELKFRRAIPLPAAWLRELKFRRKAQADLQGGKGA